MTTRAQGQQKDIKSWTPRLLGTEAARRVTMMHWDSLNAPGCHAKIRGSLWEERAELRIWAGRMEDGDGWYAAYRMTGVRDGADTIRLAEGGRGCSCEVTQDPTGSWRSRGQGQQLGRRGVRLSLGWWAAVQSSPSWWKLEL